MRLVVMRLAVKPISTSRVAVPLRRVFVSGAVGSIVTSIDRTSAVGLLLKFAALFKMDLVVDLFAWPAADVPNKVRLTTLSCLAQPATLVVLVSFGVWPRWLALETIIVALHVAVSKIVVVVASTIWP